MIRPIHPGLSPNVEYDDFIVSLKRIFQFWKYTSGSETKRLEKWFDNIYKTNAFAFSSGRGALFAILKNLDVKRGDEVLVTGFTCVAVVDAVIKTGARPVYVDILDTFQLDMKDLKKKITKNTKVLILQHTFGISSATKEILQFTKEKKILVAEDLAHGIGIRDKNKLLGTDGIASIVSFGRDKAFSCVSGGVAMTNDKTLSDKLREFQNTQKESSKLWVFQNLFHMVSFYILILPLYDFFSLGKALLVSFQKLGLLARPIDTNELDHFALYTAKLSPALAGIALHQLQKLQKFNAIRKKYTQQYELLLRPYYSNLIVSKEPLLRYPVLVDNPKQAKKLARKHTVYLGDWYSNSIDPKGTSLAACFYAKGICPTAEYIASHIVNLPTYPTLSEKSVKKVATILIDYAQNSTNNT